MSLNGKTVIISGAGGGIGSLAVERFCKEGCRVVAADMNLEAAQKAVEGKNAIAVKNDITNLADCEKLVKAATEYFGTIDVLVCNAGISLVGNLDELAPETFEKVINVNVLGVYNLIKASLEHLSQDASIVITSSKAAKRGVPGFSHYVASKHALFGLAQSLAYELGDRGIRVNCVCPGDLVSGRMWQENLINQLGAKFGMNAQEMMSARSKESPLGRFCYNTDIGEAMIFLADNEKSGYITAQNIDVTGGVTVN